MPHSDAIQTKTVVWGCRVPLAAQEIPTEKLVKIPAGSIGYVVSESLTTDGASFVVACFDEDLWAWIGLTAFTYIQDPVSDQP
jgi:hypothetical protein